MKPRGPEGNWLADPIGRVLLCLIAQAPKERASKARGSALVVLAKSRLRSGSWTEGIPGPGEVSHSLQSQPNRLRPWHIGPVRAVDVPAQLSDESQHLGQFRRPARGSFLMNRHPDRLPLRWLKDRLAIHVRTTASQAAHHQRPPRHRQVHRHTRKQALDVFKSPLLHSAARFQGAEENFNHPADTVVLNDLPHVVRRVDGQRRRASMPPPTRHPTACHRG